MFSKQLLSSFILLSLFITINAETLQTESFSQENTFRLQLENVNYFVNNEYFNDIQTGYTFPGTWLRPSLVWELNSAISFNGGIFLQKQFGTDTVAISRLSISAVWKINRDLKFTIGDYDAVNSYQLPTQLLDKEAYFISPFDQGILLEWMPSRLESRVWVSWERYITAGDPFREEIFGGLSGIYTLYNKSQLSLKLPFGFTAYHKGGQIDASSMNKQNLFNRYCGIQGAFGKVGLEANYLAFSNNVDVPETAYDKGKAIEFSVVYRPERWSFKAAYWYGDMFYSPLGKPIFKNISSINDVNNEPVRRLLNGEIDYKVAIGSSAHFAFNSGLYYDLSTTTLDYGFSVSLILSPSVLLFK